ncbi:hypothetical protein [Bacteroides sp.]|uniref:hypothetical protein n=1 Tax=Bacteroides sp. TaxID=29523 RepID=UPI002634C5A8|nr:hypothetical protein [Bacteroides sp.]MDD3039782.1 hypothetical protein [Bacteroides sp.]
MPTFDLTKHRELWNWLADNPGQFKEDWPGWYDIEDYDPEIYPDNNCFACQYSKEHRLATGKYAYDFNPEVCEETCPLLWGTFRTCCDTGSIFSEWDNVNDKCSRCLDVDGVYAARAEALARDIAELPVREGVETE